MVYALVFPHLLYNLSCDHDYVILFYTPSYVVSPKEKKKKEKEKEK